MDEPDPALAARLARFRAAFEAGIGARGIPWPEANRYKWGLMYLWERIGQPVSQEELVDFYRDHGLGRYDRQIRHMAAQGWFLVSSMTRSSNMLYDPDLPTGSLALRSLSEVNPRHAANRSSYVAPADWQALVALFERVRGGCAMCGTACERYDRGHLDRRIAPTGENLVPLCSPCNNWLQAMNLDAYLEHRSLIARPMFPGTERYNRRLMKSDR